MDLGSRGLTQTDVRFKDAILAAGSPENGL